MTWAPTQHRRAMRKARGTRVIDRLAEEVAECGDITVAAARLGINRKYADNLFHRIKVELGLERCR